MLNKGIQFPLTILNGNLAVVTEADLFKGHILSWLQTSLRERVMRPAYGMQDYLFNNVADLSFITSSIKVGLQDYVPDVSFDVQGTVSDLGEAEFYVYWTYQDSESILKVTL